MPFLINKAIEYGIAFITLYLSVFFILLFLKNRNEVAKSPAQDRRFQPSLSVIVPAFNEGNNIRHCIESVLAADYPKERLEIIIVDDGSQDNTHMVAKELEKKDGRIRAFTKPNEGKAAALNYGISKARNEIIATLDADSFIEKDAIWKMMPYFKEPDVVAVTAAVKVLEEKHKAGFLQVIQKIEYLFTLFSRRVLTYIEAVTVTPGPFSMFRAWVFEKIGGFDTKCILEDQEIALRIQKHNYKIRSSLDAEVYTEIPHTFNELLKQRIRWHRGGLRNSLKYLSMISPRYGDFGLIIMPLTFIALLALFGVFVVAIVNYFTQPSYFASLGLEAVFLGITPVHIIGMFIFALNLIWISWGVLHFRNEGISAWQILLYIVSYSYLLTLYWAAAIIKELKMEKLTW